MYPTDVSPRQWHVLKAILPPSPRVGRPYRDHRQVVNGILWRLRHGTPWREIPPRYGPWQTCYDRFRRWDRDGTWRRLLRQLQGRRAASIDWHALALDSTHVRAHRSARGARHPDGDEGLGRTRGGLTSKLHLLADQHARPLAVRLTAGPASDPAHLRPTLDELAIPIGPGRVRRRPRRLLLDRAYGARCYRQQLRRLHIQVVCPERRDARTNRLRKGARGGRPTAFDAVAYRGRNVVERCINRLKDFRCIATRYDKRGRCFLTGVLVVMILLWL